MVSAGIDAKAILSTSMNLDLTVNPDYSQVEVDRQVTNLDRFELFFPEKRQFYLENSDLFANLGKDNLRPFFSRRIGLESPVLAGARLSGKIGNNWRIGLWIFKPAAKIPYRQVILLLLYFSDRFSAIPTSQHFLVNKQVMNTAN
jgi:hypothetical protein